MEKLLIPNFWFNARPGEMSVLYQNVFIVLLGFLFLLIIVSKTMIKQKSFYWKIWERFFNFSITNFCFGLIVYFFAYEMAPILSARFWFLLLIIEIAVWLVFIFNDLRKIPKMKMEKEKKKEFEKYIP